MHIKNSTLNTIVTMYQWDKTLKKQQICQGPDTVHCFFFPHIILSWNCLSLIQTVMGLGIKAFFEESSKARICLSSLYELGNPCWGKIPQVYAKNHANRSSGKACFLWALIRSWFFCSVLYFLVDSHEERQNTQLRSQTTWAQCLVDHPWAVWPWARQLPSLCLSAAAIRWRR